MSIVAFNSEIFPDTYKIINSDHTIGLNTDTGKDSLISASALIQKKNASTASQSFLSNRQQFGNKMFTL
jgi:hypothetical protein